MRLFPNKRVVVAFPPARTSEALKRAADGFTHIGRAALVDSLFPEIVVKQNGIELRRPP